MIQLTAAVTGLEQLQKDLKVESARQKKALDAAVRVEAFRLRRELQREIRAGAPGGVPFAPPSMITRLSKKRRRALTPLARAVRYHVERKDPLEIAVGWVGPLSSASWQRIATVQQQGFSYTPAPGRRRELARQGGDLLKSGRRGRMPWFFLRRATRVLTTPPRPIIAPFWQRQEPQVRVNITRNYVRKLRGERI